MRALSASFYGQIRAILSSASKKDLAEVATWRLGKFLDACRREFGHDKRLIEMDDSPYPNDRQVEAGIKLFQQYDRERAASIRQTVSKEDEARFVTYMRSMFAMLDKKPADKRRTTKRQSRSTSRRKR